MKIDASSELSFFVLLAKHANLSATARALDITPPAATKRLALMEQRLQNDGEAEIREALQQIYRIALLRLQAAIEEK